MPTIPFPGSKGRLAKQIVAPLPKHGRTYCEPFCGRGNLFWAAATAGLKYEKWWLNDISTIPFFRAVQRIGHTIKVPNRCREEYERQREAYKSGDLNAELLQPFLTFNGGGYFEAGCKGREHVTKNEHGGGVSGAGYERTIRECHHIMRKTRPRLTTLDWRKMGLEELGPQDTVVLDPPYPGCDVGSYTDASLNYEELVDALLSARFRWVLCGYLHPALHRLGRPIWARDVQLITVPPDDRDSRTECLWSSNLIARDKRHVLPSTLSSRLRIQDQAASLSFTALDAKIDHGLETVAKDWNALVPYLLEMHRRLCAPGRRTDLRKGAPANLS
jgi:site-specific DNA-adenine methylase